MIKNIYLDSLEISSIKNDGTYRLRTKDINKFRNIEPLNIAENIDGRKIFAWSDTHFFHENIIEFCNRPFTYVEQMNETLLSNYNAIVGHNDVCIWIGDVGLGPKFTAEGMNEILDFCHGYKILIIGNHDLGKWENLNFNEKYVVYCYKDFIFTHYPWEAVLDGFYNIHGHIHAHPDPENKINNPRLFNVNCEMHDYMPINLNMVEQALKSST